MSRPRSQEGEQFPGVVERRLVWVVLNDAKIASLPDMVRGYEQIKVQNVRRYREAPSSAPDDRATQIWTYHRFPDGNDL